MFNEEEIIEACVAAQLLDHDKLKVYAEKKRPILSSLITDKVITEYDIARAAAVYYGLECVNLGIAEISDEVLALVPKKIARYYQAIPLEIRANRLIIAISDPSNLPQLDSLKIFLDREVEFVCMASSQLETVLTKYYGEKIESLEEAPLSTAPESHCIGKVEEAPLVKLLSHLIVDAYDRHASDIHLEPMSGRIRVRFRIDGSLQEIQNLSHTLQTALINRLKVMSGRMDITEKRLPQDGRIRFQLPCNQKSLDLRLSIIPTLYGESAVIRLLDPIALSHDLSDLGLNKTDQVQLEQIIHTPNGMVLITGPTGCGKTTTLYACLQRLNQPDRKIITIEDPIEYQMAGVNQVSVNSEVGMTFPAALRSILRQSPNVIMIGEIRDSKTAHIAVQASLTGHLVFSTLHTNDAPSAVTRLIDIGVAPFLLASSLRAIIAQRLVRHLCTDCKQSSTLSQYECRLLNLPVDYQDNSVFSGSMRAVGCVRCHGKGFRGRVGIFEIFIIDDEVQNLLAQSASSYQSHLHHLKRHTLEQDGAAKVLAGLTTAQEVIAATLRKQYER